MDIDFKDPKLIRWMLTVLVVGLVVAGFFMTTLFPFTYPARKAEIGELEGRHQELSRDLEKARALVANLARVEKETETLRQQWEISKTLLPETSEMPELLRKVTAAGQQSGVDFEVFRPGMPLPQGFYADNPVEVRVRGGYHQTGVFLSRLANLNRIVNISDLAMKELEDQEETPFTVETALTLTAYTLGGGAMPAVPAEIQKQLAAKSAEKQGGKKSKKAASSH